jgi:HEAT repeat protein
MRRLILLILLAFLAGGCRSKPTPMSGGKPLSHWLAALQSGDDAARKTAAFKLGNAGAADPAVLPALLKALKDHNADVRRAAIVALMKCGPGAREAIPILDELQRLDHDANVRTCAGLALHKLGGEVVR